MGITLAVGLLRADDEVYRKKLKAAQAMIDAGFELTAEMELYFDTCRPKFGDGLKVDHFYPDDHVKMGKRPYLSHNENQELLIDLKKLPEDIRYLKFFYC